MSTPLKREPKVENNNAQGKIMSHFKVDATKGPSQNNPCASSPGSIKAKSGVSTLYLDRELNGTNKKAFTRLLTVLLKRKRKTPTVFVQATTNISFVILQQETWNKTSRYLCEGSAKPDQKVNRSI